MVQVLPAEQGLGGLLGLGLGAGLQEGVQDFLTQRKQQKEATSLAKFLGLNEEQSEAFQRLTPEQQKLSVGLIQQQQKLQQQQKKEAAFGQALESILGRGPPVQQAPQVGEPIAATGLGIQELGKLAEISQREQKEKQRVASQRVGPLLKRADEIREVLPVKEFALNSMKNAIETENLGFFSKNNLAELTGIEAFRTAKGAAFVTAGKEFFLGSIRRAGPRPNIFVEKLISKMMPQVGRSREANQVVAASFQADLDVEKERLRLTDELEQKSLDEKGFVPGNLGALITKELKPFAKKRLDQLEQEMRDITERKKGKELTTEMATKFLKAAKGDKAKARELARKQGFVF